MKIRLVAAVLLLLAPSVAPLPLRAQPPHSAPAPPPTPSIEEAPLILDLKTDTNLAPGKPARVQVGIKNRSTKPVALTAVTVGDKTRVDALAGTLIAPGKTVRWKGNADVRMPSGMEYGPGIIALNVQFDTGTLEVLRDVRRLEPLELRADFDERPVYGGAENKDGDTRSVKITLLSRAAGRTEAQVTLALPTGWRLVEGKTTEMRTLREGERKQITYKILVPLPVPLGEYTVGVAATAGGRTYKDTGIIAVTR